MNLCRELYISVGLVLAGYMALYLIGQGPLAHLYTPEWASRQIWFVFAPLTLAVAMFGPPRAWWWSLGGFPVGVTVGHLIGETAHGSHPGWWIAILIFLVATVTGWLVQRRRPATVACSRV